MKTLIIVVHNYSSIFIFDLNKEEGNLPGIDELRKAEKKPHNLKIEKLLSVPYEEALGRKTPAEEEEETYIKVPRRIIGGFSRVSYILPPKNSMAK